MVRCQLEKIVLILLPFESSGSAGGCIHDLDESASLLVLHLNYFRNVMFDAKGRNRRGRLLEFLTSVGDEPT